jgi:hypothetical protein
MSDLLIAVVGGSVGVLIPTAVRGLTIPADVRLNDEAIRDRDEQLGTWVADRHVKLSKDCKALRAIGDPGTTPQEKADAMRFTGYAHTPAHLNDVIADVRAQALHEYRDEERRAKIDRARALASEGWAHRALRRLSNAPAPALKSPVRATPLLDLWRKPSGLGGGAMVTPDDATQRTLDAVLNARLIEP